MHFLLLIAALHSPIRDASFVRIGGIDQWVTITGDDLRNPIVLFLHGGPGDPYSPYADSMFAGWQKNFTLVQWDQRGAGRTYARNGPSVEPTMTFDRMVRDGIEVAEYLTEHLGQKKIFLVGGSWGSFLGIEMVRARPDLFAAYIGVAQMVNWRENVRASYGRVLQLAREAHDEPAIADLTALGPPPWSSLRQWPKFRKWLVAYQKRIATAPAPNMNVAPEYDNEADRAAREASDDFSFVHFIGMTMNGPETQIDLPSLGTKFSIPIDFVQGEDDLKALPELAKAYFDRIESPRKAFYLVPASGHEFSVPMLARVRAILSEQASAALANRDRAD
ncbi:MAG TPA: alpha/beta fold hydrolase [Thermoanaerobaculia bacterium]|nr:alpha/beta fold hydrolase [Thermoanaerobaculia bacterium]